MKAPSIHAADFLAAFEKVFPSVGARDLARYRGMRKKLRGSRANIQPKAEAEVAAAAPAAAAGSSNA